MAVSRWPADSRPAGPTLPGVIAAALAGTFGGAFGFRTAVAAGTGLAAIAVISLALRLGRGAVRSFTRHRRHADRSSPGTGPADQAAAGQAAAGQAGAGQAGAREILLSLFIRNQALLHSQLDLIDSMERQTGDPGLLADLFRLDHLATRMRRHTEILVTLSGGTPGRGWRYPVPMADALNAAVAEIEDYRRVDVITDSGDGVAGSAVSDVIHLLAEMIENAAVFSPPDTRIELRAGRTRAGLVAEIEDRGGGLPAGQRAQINRCLAGPTGHALASDGRLGLFMVSQLARRHGIGVCLRASASGGTTAVVLMPYGLIVPEENLRARASAGGAAAASGRPGGEPPAAAWDGAADTGNDAPSGGTGRHRSSPASRDRAADDSGRPGPVPSGGARGMPVRFPRASTR